MLDQAIQTFANLIKEGYLHWECSQRDGLLQKIDPRVKTLLMAALLILVSAKKSLFAQVSVFFLLSILIRLSQIPFSQIFKPSLTIAFLFGVVIPLPTLLNIFQDQKFIIPIIHLESEHSYKLFWGWSYTIPKTIGISESGFRGIELLFFRMINSISLSLLLLHTTSFSDLIQTLRTFRIPETLISIATLTYKYLFYFARIVQDIYLAKKSRRIRPMMASESREWASDRIAYLFYRCQDRSEKVYQAMRSRGFENQASYSRTSSLNKQLKPLDSCFLLIGLVILIGITIL